MRKLLFVLVFLTTFFQVVCASPRLAVIFIVDQFAYHYIEKIRPHLNGGLSKFINDGIWYKNAYVPHAYPATAAGHATINTGAYPKDHGIIGNSWLDSENKKINFETNNVNKKYSIFSPTGTYDKAASGENIMVDGISDQFVLKSTPKSKYQVFALSDKRRAAIALAGKLGKAVWFDSEAAQFTSSKAYFDKMPDWLSMFNKEFQKTAIPKTFKWTLLYKDNPAAYDFFDTKNYDFVSHKFSLINHPIKIVTGNSNDEYEKLYIKTPFANQDILDLAKMCLDSNLKDSEKMILWVSISALDPLGHYYGPDSQETLDLLYRLDKQLDEFMKYVETKEKNVLFALSADHGVMPIIEILEKRGMNNLHRINFAELIEKINKQIESKFKIKNITIREMNKDIYLDKKIFNALSKKQRKAIEKEIIKIVEAEPGVVKVWTYRELEKLPVIRGSIDEWFKNQIYPERSGQLVYKCTPYSALTSYKKGTQHKTPYEYDTHVPLAIYQKGIFEKKVVEKKVLLTQIAPSIAKIFNVNRPSASRAKTLPGI